ncbi:uncharacterized protein LOC142978550 [Anticarsia gemmatalis]|uniref:uncharacterized protein LOC142978550 n=1 Tax=Anticarsia gemmatalis TaxID=129554 RepID=UPI003F75D5AA
MGHDKFKSLETSHEQHVKRHLRVLYTRETHEKEVFMNELKAYRRQKDKEMFRSIRDSVGPRWYQALSVPQRTALDSLATSIYQDLLEGRPVRTATVMRALGLYPRPSYSDLMTCNYLGREDPKEMLAQLYNLTFGYSIEGKRFSYTLNARLILSAILYLGQENLIQLLRERFRPDVVETKRPPRPVVKPEPPLKSPYLQKLVAFLWEKPRRKRKRPAPLPNLDDLDDPYEEEPIMLRTPPPAPPPPKEKKRSSRAVCDQIAGVIPIEPRKPSVTDVPYKKAIRPGHRRGRSSKGSLPEKKTYGMGSGKKARSAVRRKKPVAPSTGMHNAQYNINGVFEINGKMLFILGSVSILPAHGDLIHGGYAHVGTENINIHCGFRGRPPPLEADPCDCLKKWQNTVFKYVKDNKCYCGHHYDFGNEGTFPPDELPFFMKPTRHSPLHFNYQTIFDLDPKHLHIEKEFKKLWDTDSVLHVDDGTIVVKDDKKKKKKKSSKTCLGANPRPEDYLKCALRFMRRVNIAARLPDLHLVPELKEWMRRRLYGPYSSYDKREFLRKSNTYWQFFATLDHKGFGHVYPPANPEYKGHTNWIHKQRLNEQFRTYTQKYKLSMFRSHAYVTNLLWRTMYQAEFPDKQFRQIYFSYMFGRLEDLTLIQPYSSREAAERARVLSSNRYICLPAGAENLEK